MSEKQSLIVMILEKWEVITGGLAAFVTALWGGKAYIKKEIDKAQDDQLKKHSEEIKELKNVINQKIEKDKIQDSMINELREEITKLETGQAIMLTKFEVTHNFLKENLDEIKDQMKEIIKKI